VINPATIQSARQTASRGVTLRAGGLGSTTTITTMTTPTAGTG
jgi:hypothetical protein